MIILMDISILKLIVLLQITVFYRYYRLLGANNTASLFYTTDHPSFVSRTFTYRTAFPIDEQCSLSTFQNMRDARSIS